MAIPLVDLKAQYRAIKPDLDAAVARILDNTSFILGAEVERFEAMFAQYCGTAHAIGVSSGTDALQLSLLACGVGAGDEVITTPYTFIATAAAITHVGATPVFVDIHPDTCNIDPARIAAAITPRTKAILPVHLYGQPADMDAINAIARKHNLRVIEDACQAVGAVYRGRKAGNLGDLGCFSFYPSKNLGAAGDGGMVTTNDAALAEHIRCMRDHGRTGKYTHGVIGFTYRLDALQAAVLAVKLPHLDAWNEARRRHARAFNTQLAALGIAFPREAEGCRAVYHVYAIRSDRRDALLEHLHARGVGASVHYPLPLHLQPAYAHLGIAKGAFPVAEDWADQELSLPMYPELTEAQIEEIVQAVASF
jgi:dTDP-4-amino-4,6-dideoxygalactose transaminase